MEENQHAEELMENIYSRKEEKKLGYKLTKYMGICACQRKLKSFVSILNEIHTKIVNKDWKSLTPHEHVICALLDSKGLLTHGVNMEYPLLDKKEFWEWVVSIKDSPHLEDN